MRTTSMRFVSTYLLLTMGLALASFSVNAHKEAWILEGWGIGKAHYDQWVTEHDRFAYLDIWYKDTKTDGSCVYARTRFADWWGTTREIRHPNSCYGGVWSEVGPILSGGRSHNQFRLCKTRGGCSHWKWVPTN